MWKFQDFSVTKILHKVNFGHFEAPKTAILTICTALIFEFLGTFDISRVKSFQISKFKAFKIVKTAPIEISQD